MYAPSFFRDIAKMTEREYLRSKRDRAIKFPPDLQPSKIIKMIYGRRGVTDPCARITTPIELSNIQANVADLQIDPSNAGALFQVASNFHALEQISKNSSPESTLLEDYVFDQTQGPIAVLETPADLIYRRYCLPSGPYSDAKLAAGGWPLDMLQKAKASHNVGITVGGWADINELTHPLEMISDKTAAATRVGSVLVEGALVSHNGNGHLLMPPERRHRINHVLASVYDASGDMYGKDNDLGWADAFLMAAYINTLEAAVVTGSNKIYLTTIGAGVFQNMMSSVVAAIAVALATVPLPNPKTQVYIVHYGSIDLKFLALRDFASGKIPLGSFFY